MKTKLTSLMLLLAVALTMTQCSTESSGSSSSSRTPVAGNVMHRVYESGGHRYLEERRIIAVNPLETVTTTTQMAEPPAKH